MKNIRNNNGITLVTLAITIVVMLILTVSITASMKSTIEIKKYNSVKEDIISLSEAIKEFYLDNEKLPIDSSKVYKLSDYGVPTKDINPNDSNDYYRIDISNFSEIELNNGENNNNENNQDTDDMYVVNEKSLTVYYLRGAVLNGQKHYTIVDDFSGGAFAEDYYSEAKLPLMSVVKLESNGKNKSLACTGDTVTLKMLTNYELDTKPQITINGESVTATWNGLIGTATYTIPYKTDNLKYGDKVKFNISNYNCTLINKSGESTVKEGEEITDVSFGKGVTRYAETLVQAFKAGNLNIGDYVDYNKYVNESNTYTSKVDQNGWADQTYTATQETSWRVLGLNESKDQLILISANPIAKNMDTSSTNDWDKNPYLYMKGAYGYVNCVKMLDGISGIYSTSLGTAKSLTAKEINRLLGITVDKENKKVYVNTAPDTNIDVPGVLGNTYTYKSTDYTPESYIAGKNVDTNKIPSVTADAYYYRWENLTIDTALKEILFSGTTESDKYSKSYWLASPGVYANERIASFGPGDVYNGYVGEGGYTLFISYGRWFAYRLGVRPVVYLNSEVSADDLQKTEAGTDTWNYDNSNSDVANGNKDNGLAGIR